MPLFSNRKGRKDDPGLDESGHAYQSSRKQNYETAKYHHNGVSQNSDFAMATEQHKPKLVFHCQQAQGSPTGVISGFSNVRELYTKIAECYDFPPDDVSTLHSLYYNIYVYQWLYNRWHRFNNPKYMHFMYSLRKYAIQILVKT